MNLFTTPSSTVALVFTGLSSELAKFLPLIVLVIGLPTVFFLAEMFIRLVGSATAQKTQSNGNIQTTEVQPADQDEEVLYD